jgi:putative ABC transport system permease protein
MIKAYFKFAIRNLLKNKFYSFINIFGLAIGIALFILIVLFVKSELSFDKFNENYENIHRLEFGEWVVMPPGLAPLLAAEIPELETYTRFFFDDDYLLKYKEKDYSIPDICYADSTYTDIFSTNFLRGDGKKTLTEVNSVALSDKMARIIFGNEDPIGKVINLNNRFDAKINAIFESKDNSHLKFDAIFSMTTLEGWRGKEYVADVNSSNFPLYYLLPENVNLENLYLKIADFIAAQYNLENADDWELGLRPLPELYFYTGAQFEAGAIHGNKQIVNAFIAIAIFIIIIACINFINLSTARANVRAKEVGLKKVVGSYKSQLIRQFLTEAIIVTFVALIFAVTFVQIALPKFNFLVDKSFEFTQITSLASVSLMILGVIIIGILSGLYPALYLTAFNPIDAVKGEATKGSRAAIFRKSLIIFQFVISIVLIISTIAAYEQLIFMKNKDLGFNKEDVVYFNCTRGMLQSEQTKKSFKTKLLENPNIKAVSYCQGVPGDHGNEQTFQIDGESRQFKIMPVEPDFFDVFDIEILEGRTFRWDQPTDETATVLINETAAKYIGWDSIVGKTIITGTEGFSAVGPKIRIIGIMKDFHMRSLHSDIPPMMISWKNDWCWRICMRINTNNISSTVDHIENTWYDFNPKYPFKYNFIDKIFEREYRKEERLAETFIYFAILAIFIASLGLFGLASFVAQQRTKEIGVRKVLGATSASVINLLSKEFSLLVVVANILAWPIAYYALHQWLKDFAFHIDLKIWFFIVGAIIAFIIAFLTVSAQSLKIAQTDPIKSIKYE